MNGSRSLPHPILLHHNRHRHYPSAVKFNLHLRFSRAAMAPHQRSYDQALNCLSSLITRRTRADPTNRGDCFELMFDYVKMLELEEAVEKLNIVHVAGTKGKGSTCTFTESILRHCGMRTGLFTSPHLIDVRERFRLDGAEISVEKFLEYFWWCWDRLQERTGGDVPMPIYFRFLSLLAFKIFSAEQVRAPTVCGISSLGYDHMEILGYTLEEIAGEKAGIFKRGVPAYTMPQPEEAMSVLEAKASQLGIALHVAAPLDVGSLKGQRLGLDGEHQYLNAGLAVALCRAWLQRTRPDICLSHNGSLPEQFIRGLVTARLQGRAQIIPDPDIMKRFGNLGPGGLVYYLDGAHSPESIDMCARWFSHVTGEDRYKSDHSREHNHESSNAIRILLFNCMSVRDPQLLLPRLVNTCASHGVHFHKAVFVPNQSLFNKVGSHASLPATDPQQVDVSWQLTLQRVWENLICGENGPCDDKIKSTREDRKNGDQTRIKGCESSLVFPSIPVALKWIKDNAQHNRSIHFQVLVTGSLHLVGDVLKLIRK